MFKHRKKADEQPPPAQPQEAQEDTSATAAPQEARVVVSERSRHHHYAYGDDKAYVRTNDKEKWPFDFEEPDSLHELMQLQPEQKLQFVQYMTRYSLLSKNPDTLFTLETWKWSDKVTVRSE